MRNKSKLIIALFLSFLIIFSNISFVFAEDEVVNTEEPQIEQVEKTETEEVKIEEVVAEEPQVEEIKIEKSKTEEVKIEEIITEEVKEEPKEEIIETEKVTVQFQVLKPNGNYANAGGGSSVIIKKGETGSKTFTIKAEDKKDVSMNNEPLTYVYLGTWGDGEYKAPEGKIKLDRVETFNKYKQDGQKEVYVVIKADYQPTSNKLFTFNATGYITITSDNWTHSWSNSENGSLFTGYTWKCQVAGNVPDNYEFVYWEDIKTEEQYYAGDNYNYSAINLTTDTTVNFNAVYQPIITINYYSEDGTFLGSVTDISIDIYNSGNQFKNRDKFLGWYEDGVLVEEGMVRKLDLTTVEVQTDFDVYAKYEKNPELIPESTPDKPKPKPPVNPTVQPTQPTPQTEDIIIATTNPPTTTINPAPTPKAEPEGSWALINLITTILTCICALAFLFVRKDTEDDEPTDEEKKDMRKILATKIASILVGIISVIAFILTEDMSLPMILTDKWTFLMILLLIIEIVNIFIIRRQSKGEEDDDNN